MELNEIQLDTYTRIASCLQQDPVGIARNILSWMARKHQLKYTSYDIEILTLRMKKHVQITEAFESQHDLRLLFKIHPMDYNNRI